jgi:hypothetical protein
MELFLMILVGAIAFRGAASLVSSAIHDGPLYVPLWTTTPSGHGILTIYMFAAIPIAFLNGFLLHYRFMESLTVGIGTWLGMLAANIFLRFNPAIQFMLFGLINLIWTTVNVTRILT